MKRAAAGWTSPGRTIGSWMTCLTSCTIDGKAKGVEPVSLRGKGVLNMSERRGFNRRCAV